jgi:hypothetical protein
MVLVQPAEIEIAKDVAQQDEPSKAGNAQQVKRLTGWGDIRAEAADNWISEA